MKIFHKKIKGSKTLNKAVLVLNANYSPMMICSAKHAIGMVYLEKVDVLVNYPQKVKSPNKFFDLPSIIKIRNYVRHDNLSVELNRKNILSRDKQICQYCGKSNLKLTIDSEIQKLAATLLKDHSVFLKRYLLTRSAQVTKMES